MKKGKQIIPTVDWLTPGAKTPWGPQQPGSTIQRHRFENEKTSGPISVSPFAPERDFIVAKLALVFVDALGKPIYSEATAPVKGRQLVTPPPDANYAPAERNETVPMSQVQFMPAFYEAIRDDVPDLTADPATPKP